MSITYRIKIKLKLNDNTATISDFVPKTNESKEKKYYFLLGKSISIQPMYLI